MHRGETDFERFYLDRAPRLARRWYACYSDLEDLEDDIQDTMLAISRKWHEMKSWSPEEQNRYMNGIMRRKCVDTYRENGRIKRLRHILQFQRNRPHLIHVEESALKNDAVRALLNLPPKQRMVLALHVLEEMSYAEIAICLGMKPSTVRTHVERARKTLVEQFNDDGLDGLGWKEGRA